MEIELILCATDGSPSSSRTLEMAAGMARRWRAEVLLLHVRSTHPTIRAANADDERVESFYAREAELLRSVAGDVAAAAKIELVDHGVEDPEVLVVEGDPAAEIVRLAEEREADLIVMGARGLGPIGSTILGGVPQKVAHLAPCSCLVVR